MPKIMQLTPHVANLIAAGEVVERPASVAKELLENAVDAGAAKVTVEVRDGGMTYLRVTDDGCGMSPEDAPTAFLRHATSKLREAEDLAAIGTMGFRGEALAAIASVSRVDLLTKPHGAVAGVSLHLEAGAVTETAEAGCPEGTTIIVRDLFFNTPARMKFMKQDSVEAGAVTAAVQRQALAHPQVAFRLIRDGKPVLNTPGDGKLLSAVAGIYGREAASLVPVDGQWDKHRVTGFVSLPSQARPSRAHQLFFVNGRPVKSKLLQGALEEAYRNQMMTGRFPACVLHLQLPPNRVDVNVHPAKTDVKFLAEREVFDCVRYGVMTALEKAQDRPELRLEKKAKAEETFRTMTAQEYRQFAAQLHEGAKPNPEKAANAYRNLAQPVRLPEVKPMRTVPALPERHVPVLREGDEQTPEKAEKKGTAGLSAAQPEPAAQSTAADQVSLPMPAVPAYTVQGELFSTYIIVQGEQEAYLIDKHAAHERILFEQFRASRQETAAQNLLDAQACRLGPEGAAVVQESAGLLAELGYGFEPFGEGTVLLRQAPMGMSPEQAADSLAALAQDLLDGRREDRDSLRDRLLHTMACKAAVKAGWHTSPAEREALVKAVLSRPELQHCPHGRPVCVRLTRQQLERQFGRA